MFKSGAFYSRMHTENTLSKLPMKVTYLVSKQCLIGKLVRWTLLLQAFEFNIIHRPGVQHAVAHYLSWLDSGEPRIGVHDDFPDAQLFRVEVENTTKVDDEIADLWLTTMKDVVKYYRQCDLCERMGQHDEKDQMPHQPVQSLEHFKKWGLDFVGSFKPPTTRKSNRYISWYGMVWFQKALCYMGWTLTIKLGIVMWKILFSLIILP